MATILKLLFKLPFLTVKSIYIVKRKSGEKKGQGRLMYSLVSSVVLLREHEGGQEVAHKADSISHGRVKCAQKWPPLIQHFLRALDGEVSRNKKIYFN